MTELRTTGKYRVERSDGTEHFVKKNDQFTSSAGDLYQVCIYKGSLRLWHVNSSTTLPLYKIKDLKLSLVEEVDEDAIYSDRFIHQKLWAKPMRSKTSLKLAKDERTEIEKRIFERAKAEAKKPHLVKLAQHYRKRRVK